MSPFANARSYDTEAEEPGSPRKSDTDKVGDGAGGGSSSVSPPAAKGGRFSLRNIIGRGASDAGYRLVANDVDPRYASTGGKLELARAGLGNEHILKELQVWWKSD